MEIPSIMMLLAVAICTASEHELIQVTQLEDIKPIEFQEKGDVQFIKQYLNITIDLDVEMIIKATSLFSNQTDLLETGCNRNSLCVQNIALTRENIATTRANLKELIYELQMIKYQAATARVKRSFANWLEALDESFGLLATKIITTGRELSDGLKKILFGSLFINNVNQEYEDDISTFITINLASYTIKSQTEKLLEAVLKRKLNPSVIGLKKFRTIIEAIDLDSDLEHFSSNPLFIMREATICDATVRENVIELTIQIPVVKTTKYKVYHIQHNLFARNNILAAYVGSGRYIVNHLSEITYLDSLENCIITIEEGKQKFACKLTHPISTLQMTKTDCELSVFKTGVVSELCKNNIKTFAAADLTTVMDYEAGLYVFTNSTAYPNGVKVNAICDDRSNEIFLNTSARVSTLPDCILMVGSHKIWYTTTMKKLATSLNVLQRSLKWDFDIENIEPVSIQQPHFETIDKLIEEISSSLKFDNRLKNINMGK